jgi:hypothetical protein
MAEEALIRRGDAGLKKKLTLSLNFEEAFEVLK